MSKIAVEDQWLDGGDCTKCRRQKYCSKSCTESKRFAQRRVLHQATVFATEIVKSMIAKEEGKNNGQTAIK